MTDVTDIMLDASVYNLATQKNVTVGIMTDDSPSNPRMWDNIGTMYITDKHIDNLGDIFIPNFDEALEEHASIIAYFADRLGVKKSDIIIKDIIFVDYGSERSLYLNEHTPGATYQGYMVTTKQIARDAHQVKQLSKELLARVDANLDGEVKIYTEYLNGNVYGYNITCDLTGQNVDSVWGFYGDDPYLNEAIKDVIEAWTPPAVYTFKFKPNLMAWSKK